MSLSDAQITGANCDLYLDEDRYIASPLNDKDFSELDNWLRGHVIKIAVDSLPPDAPKNIRDEVLSVAIKSAPTVTIRSDRGVEVLETPEGVCRLIWQMTHKNHPNKKPEDFLPYLQEVQNLTNVFMVFNQLNKNESENGKPEGNEKEGV